MNPVVEIFHKAVQLPQDCLTLMAAQPGDSLAFGAAWMDNLERTVFSEHQGIRYFTLRDEQGALAVLPTMLAKDSLGKHVSGLSNYYTAIFQPALRAGLSTLDLLPLVSELRRHHAGLASITLAPMDPGSEAYQTIEAALAQNGFGVFRYFCFGNWYLNAPESWTGYLASREGKLRSTIKRMSQRIAADKGRVEILTTAGASCSVKSAKLAGAPARGTTASICCASFCATWAPAGYPVRSDSVAPPRSSAEVTE